MKTQANIMIVLLTVLALCSNAFAGGGGVLAAPATEFTQIGNWGLLGKILEDNGFQLDKITQQLTDAQNNSLLLNDSHWTNVQDNLVALAKIVQQNQSIAYSSQNAADLFAQKYPGWSADTTKANYKAWSQNTLDMIRGSLAAANLQSSQFTGEESTLRSLRQLSQTPKGRMQAIQVGNQIAVEQVAQTQKLRQLVMSQMQAQDAYMANQEQKDATRRASVEEVFPKQKAGANHDYHGF